MATEFSFVVVGKTSSSKVVVVKSVVGVVVTTSSSLTECSLMPTLENKPGLSVTSLTVFLYPTVLRPTLV